MGQATVTLPPAVPIVPTDISEPEATARVRFARAINQAMRGNISATVRLTLVPNDTSSVFNDSRIGPFSYIELMPLTAHAAAVLPSTRVTPLKGTATIYHANFPYVDATFAALIIGS